MLYSQTQEFAELKAEFKASLPFIKAGNDPYKPRYVDYDPVKDSLSLSSILTAVCSVTDYERRALKGNRRFANIAKARQLYFILADEFSGCSGTEASRYLCKDYTTGRQAIKVGLKRIREDEEYADLYSKVRQRLGV